jgi:hypothetical protein
VTPSIVVFEALIGIAAETGSGVIGGYGRCWRDFALLPCHRFPAEIEEGAAGRILTRWPVEI